MTYYITGDCHRDFSRFFQQGQTSNSKDKAFIVLGDFCVNYYFDSSDDRVKQKLQNTGMTYYLVRGNHEARPSKVFGMGIEYDKEIKNLVYCQPQYPNIKYLIDGKVYQFGDYSALVIGGAYSVDKQYRLNRKNTNPDGDYYHVAAEAGWFQDEQLSETERNYISAVTKGIDVDFVFTHTCPIDWEPTDLFLGQINQSEVDKSMELWLSELKDSFNWKIWCFGHYHADRLERPRVEQFYHDIDSIDGVYNRWCGMKTLEEEWWLTKSPNYYMTTGS